MYTYLVEVAEWAGAEEHSPVALAAAAGGSLGGSHHDRTSAGIDKTVQYSR